MVVSLEERSESHLMSVLVLADHDNRVLKPATLNTITAACAFGTVDVLVAGAGCRAVADSAAQVKGVALM